MHAAMFADAACSQANRANLIAGCLDGNRRKKRKGFTRQVEPVVESGEMTDEPSKKNYVL
jgi:hypothetical protein